MAITDAQRLYSIECIDCLTRREGCGPEAAFVADARADGWQEHPHHAWLCPDCADAVASPVVKASVSLFDCLCEFEEMEISTETGYCNEYREAWDDAVIAYKKATGDWPARPPTPPVGHPTKKGE